MTIVYRALELERLVAATIAATGLYVERGLEFAHLCEADVFATQFQPFHRRLVEAKGGKCGASDAFKFESQRRYLEADHGAMIVGPPATTEMNDVAAWGGFDVLRTDLTRLDVTGKIIGWMGIAAPSHLIDAWERAYGVEDALLSAASDPAARRASATLMAQWTAYFTVHAPAWVRTGLEQRCRQAYNAFAAMPQAGLSRAREIDGTTTGMSTAFSEAVYQGKHPTVLAALLLEWLNRAEVVRLAAEYSLRGAPFTPPTPPAVTLLPSNFRGAVRTLRRLPLMAARLPLVLQAFIFRWGGFLIPETGEEAAIAAELGITAGEVTECLDVLTKIFPPSVAPDWFRDVFGARWLLLVPYPVQGLGVMHRDVAIPGWDISLTKTLQRRLRARAAAGAALLV